VLRKIFGPKREETDREENCIMMNFVAVFFAENC
jgi:hypothetical protein